MQLTPDFPSRPPISSFPAFKVGKPREVYNPLLDQEMMVYVKIMLSGLTAMLIAECVSSWSTFRWIGEQKATGLGAISGGLAESFFSPLFWIVALLLFALFFAASRLGNKILRVSLFWIPTLMVSAFSVAIVALLTYVVVHFRNH
jgi:hypothetical protein